MAQKATKLVSQQRVSEALKLRLRGAEFPVIQEHFKTLGWDLSDQMVYYYIHKADQILEDQICQDREALFRQHVGQRKRLYAVAMGAGDYATAHRVLKDEAELLGLYPARKTEVTGADGGPIQHAHAHLDIVAAMDQAGISLETRRRMLDDLERARALKAPEATPAAADFSTPEVPGDAAG